MEEINIEPELISEYSDFPDDLVSEEFQNAFGFASKQE